MDSTSPRGRTRPVGWLSPREAARYARTRLETMEALLRSGAIPCYPSLSSRMPGAVAKGDRVVSAEDIDAYIRSEPVVYGAATRYAAEKELAREGVA